MALAQIERNLPRLLRCRLTLSSLSTATPLMTTQPLHKVNIHTSLVNFKKGKQKQPSNKKQSVLDELIDEIDDDDDEPADEADSFNENHVVKETELKKYFDQKSKSKKPSKGSVQGQLKYEEFVKIVNGERLWQELQSQLDTLKNIFLHQLSVRSATSIGEKNIVQELHFLLLYTS